MTPDCVQSLTFSDGHCRRVVAEFQHYTTFIGVAIGVIFDLCSLPCPSISARSDSEPSARLQPSLSMPIFCGVFVLIKCVSHAVIVVVNNLLGVCVASLRLFNTFYFLLKVEV